jgi:uracil-DNA glycosylase
MPSRSAYVDVRDLIPENPDMEELRSIARGCKGCDLHELGTQTVFGEGERSAEIVLVGEQPGDQEDKQGLPFVGPAGRLLDRALDEAGIERRAVYVTNVVKHFRWVERGKRRIHRKPSMAQISACKPWLEAELDVLRPKAVVCLGATAAQALLGRDFRVSQSRGRPVESPLAPVVIATVHPSSILRGPDEERKQAMDAFVTDLALVAEELARVEGARGRP